MFQNDATTNLFSVADKNGLKLILFDMFICGDNKMTERRTPKLVWVHAANGENSGLATGGKPGLQLSKMNPHSSKWFKL